MSRPCACRRALTESELFAAHGIGRTPVVEHDQDHGAGTEQVTAEAVRERYARTEIRTVLQRLELAQQRLKVGGRS